MNSLTFHVDLLLWVLIIRMLFSVYVERRALSELEARLREAEASKQAPTKAPSSHDRENFSAVQHHHHAAAVPSGLVAPPAEEAHHGSAPLSLADLASTVDARMMHLPEVANASSSSPAHSPRIHREQPPSTNRSQSLSPEKRAAAAAARVMLRVSGSLTHDMLRDQVAIENGDGNSGDGDGGRRSNNGAGGGSSEFVEKATTLRHSTANERDRSHRERSDDRGDNDSSEGDVPDNDEGNEHHSGSSSSLDLPFHGGPVEFGSQAQGDPGSLSPPHPVRHRWPDAHHISNGSTGTFAGGSGSGGGAVSFQSTQSTLERRRDEIRLAIQGLSVQLTLALSDDENSEVSSGRKSGNDEQSTANHDARDNDETESATRQALTLELRRKRAALIEVEALLERLQGPLSSNNRTNNP
jgi:hypothetical protein